MPLGFALHRLVLELLVFINSKMRIIPKVSDETEIPGSNFLDDFIFHTISLKYIQNIEKTDLPGALFMTVYLYVK